MEPNANKPNDINRRLKTLIEFGQMITSAARLSEAQILGLIYQQTSKLMYTDNMYIALYDELDDTLRFGLVMLDGERMDKEQKEEWQSRLAVKGVIEEVIHTKKALFFTTKAEVAVWYAQSKHQEFRGDALSSCLGVPMVVGEKVFGTIIAYHQTQDNRYSKDDLEILQAIANQAAIALLGAEASETLQQELERRTAEDKFVVYLGHAADGIAHRINNTMALLPLCVSDIRRHLKTVDGFVDEQLDMIERNARYLLASAEALQKPSRPSEAGHFDINLLLEDAIKATNVPSDVELITALDKSLPKVQTRRLLVDVFVELITNAVTAMSESQYKRLEIGSHASGTKFVEIWFTDTGMGISRQAQAHIFELFYTTAEKSTEGVSKGFGLWWVKTFLTWQGGEIAFESEPGKGTTFRVRLPLEMKNQ